MACFVESMTSADAALIANWDTYEFPMNRFCMVVIGT